MTKQQRKILIKIIIGAVLFAVGVVGGTADFSGSVSGAGVQCAGKGCAEHCTRAGI